MSDAIFDSDDKPVKKVGLNQCNIAPIASDACSSLSEEVPESEEVPIINIHESIISTLLTSDPDEPHHPYYDFDKLKDDDYTPHFKKEEDMSAKSIYSNTNPSTVPEFTVPEKNCISALESPKERISNRQTIQKFKINISKKCVTSKQTPTSLHTKPYKKSFKPPVSKPRSFKKPTNKIEDFTMAMVDSYHLEENDILQKLSISSKSATGNCNFNSASPEYSGHYKMKVYDKRNTETRKSSLGTYFQTSTKKPKVLTINLQSELNAQKESKRQNSEQKALSPYENLNSYRMKQWSGRSTHSRVQPTQVHLNGADHTEVRRTNPAKDLQGKVFRLKSFMSKMDNNLLYHKERELKAKARHLQQAIITMDRENTQLSLQIYDLMKQKLSKFYT